jgi:hypothetical protein
MSYSRRVNRNSGGVGGGGGGSGGGNMRGAMYHTAIRVGTATAMLQAYSSFVAGAPFSAASLQNSVVVGAGVVAAEAVADSVHSPTQVNFKNLTGVKSALAMAITPAVTGAIYSYGYPLVFPATSASRQDLFMVAAGVDLASSFVTPYVMKVTG